MSAGDSTTAPATTGEQVEQAQTALASAEQTLTDHLVDRRTAAADLADVQARPLDVTDDEMARAEARVKRLDLAVPAFQQAIIEARAELRYVLGEHYSETLPDQINPVALTGQINAERDQISRSLRKIGRLVRTWNSLIGSTVEQCRTVDLIEGKADPFAPILATAEGSLVVHGEPRGRYSEGDTIRVRVEQALNVAGYTDRVTVTSP